MYKIIVSSKGQIVIPAELRKKLNIKGGDVLSVQIEDGGRLVIKTGRKKRIKEGIVARTSGILADMELSGLEYVENLLKGQVPGVPWSGTHGCHYCSLGQG